MLAKFWDLFNITAAGAVDREFFYIIGFCFLILLVREYAHTSYFDAPDAGKILPDIFDKYLSTLSTPSFFI